MYLSLSLPFLLSLPFHLSLPFLIFLRLSLFFPSFLPPFLPPSFPPFLPLSFPPFLSLFLFNSSPVETPSLRQFRVDRFLLLGALVVTVCILSFGPFIAMVRNIILAYLLGVASSVSEIKLAYGP